MIAFNCPNCDKRINVKDSAAGKNGRCNGCGKVVRIPNESDPPQAEKARIAELIPRPPAAKAMPLHPPVPLQLEAVEARPIANSTAAASPAVQVNIQQPSTAAHSLGIASLVVGILSFFVCWMPLIGMFLGGLGLFLGVVGLILAIVRKGSGIGFSIAGAAISSIAVVAGLIFMIFIAGTVTALDQAVQQAQVAAKQAEAKNAQAKADLGHDDVAPAAPIAEPSDPGPAWTSASESAELGSVRVDVTNVVVGKVPLWRQILDQDSESEDDLLLIRLNITNESEKKKIDYQGWMDSFASLLDIDATLVDDAGNEYRPVTFGGTTVVKDAESKGSIYPGKVLSDALVFERPIDGAKYLRLTLAGKAFGEEGDIRFEIPAEMILRQ